MEQTYLMVWDSPGVKSAAMTLGPKGAKMIISRNFWSICPTDNCITVLEIAENSKFNLDLGLDGQAAPAAPDSISGTSEKFLLE